jgi:hypothetical protein
MELQPAAITFQLQMECVDTVVRGYCRRRHRMVNGEQLQRLYLSTREALMKACNDCVVGRFGGGR